MVIELREIHRLFLTGDLPKALRTIDLFLWPPVNQAHMDSGSLSSHFDCQLQWVALTTGVEKSVPSENGCYFFRTTSGRKFGRLHGESDVIYIGSAEGLGGLRQRIYFHLHPGPSQETNLRSRWLQGRIKMEVAWPVQGNAGEMETTLLDAYTGDHWELPPLNRTAGKGSRLLHDSPI